MWGGKVFPHGGSVVYCNVCLFWFVRLESENPCAAVSLLYCYICCASLRKRASSQFVNDTVSMSSSDSGVYEVYHRPTMHFSRYVGLQKLIVGWCRT